MDDKEGFRQALDVLGGAYLVYKHLDMGTLADDAMQATRFIESYMKTQGFAVDEPHTEEGQDN